MAYTLTATTKVTISPSAVITQGLGTTTYAPTGVGKTITWANGTAANQVTKMYDGAGIIAVSTNLDIDLSGAVILGPDGASVVFTGIKYLYIENTHATQALTVGAGTNPFLFGMGGTTPTIDLPPGGYLERANPTAAGWPVANGASDILRIANGAGVQGSYKILLMGI